MIKTPKNVGFEKRWIDPAVFVDGSSTSSYELSNRNTNKVNLYDYIFSYLSRQTVCITAPAVLIDEDDVFLPVGSFLPSGRNKRTDAMNIDLFSVINTVLNDVNVCDAAIAITSIPYSVDFVKELYLSRRHTRIAQTEEFSISLKGIIDAYSNLTSFYDARPSGTITINDADPDAITVELVGLKADGVTGIDAGDYIKLWITLNGAVQAINSGATLQTAIWSAGQKTAAGDVAGMTFISGTHASFEFSKNQWSEAGFLYPITVTYQIYQDYGTDDERVGLPFSDIVPLLIGGTR